MASPSPPPGERVARLAETCQILRLAWTEERVDHSGRFHTINGAEFAPKPVQAGGPRLILGVKGDLALAVAARYADEWNWNRSQSRTEEFLERMDTLDALCDQVGRDPESLPRGIGFRRLKTALDRGDEEWSDVVDVARRCLRRGATQVVLMLDRPEDVEDEITFYSEKLIPAVMAGV